MYTLGNEIKKKYYRKGFTQIECPNYLFLYYTRYIMLMLGNNVVLFQQRSSYLAPVCTVWLWWNNCSVGFITLIGSLFFLIFYISYIAVAAVSWHSLRCTLCWLNRWLIVVVFSVFQACVIWTMLQFLSTLKFVFPGCCNRVCFCGLFFGVFVCLYDFRFTSL